MIHKIDATKQPDIKIHSLLNYLAKNNSMLRNTSSRPSYSKNPTNPSQIRHPQSWLSALFLILILSRSQLIVLHCTDLALANHATIIYLKEKKASYGTYYMWSHVGIALLISFAAGFAWLIKIPICGVEKPGYFIAFIGGFLIALLSMLSLPWFKFEYNEMKSFNWSGVKSDVLNAHHVFMFAAVFYTGLCLSFQLYWEFWYLDGLSANPLFLAGAVLIRRSLVTVSTFASTYLIRKIGDLNTICFALFLYSLSFLALVHTYSLVSSGRRHISSSSFWYQLLRLYCSVLQGFIKGKHEHYPRYVSGLKNYLGGKTIFTPYLSSYNTNGQFYSRTAPQNNIMRYYDVHVYVIALGCSVLHNIFSCYGFYVL